MVSYIEYNSCLFEPHVYLFILKRACGGDSYLLWLVVRTAACGMMEAGVARVCVSLERYFEDERARVLLTVTRGSVGDLAQRLRTCFGLPGAFCLTSRGMLLPPEEPHTLLRDGDRVE